MKKRGVGIALYNLPCGLGGAGDPSQAVIKLSPDGTFSLLVGCTDLGQGCLTIMQQLAAGELDVPLDNVMVNNRTDNFQQWCTGTFASRVTGIDASAVVLACRDLKEKMKELVGEQLEVSPDDLEVAGGRVSVVGYPDKGMSLGDLGGLVHWGGYNLVGAASFTFGPQTPADPVDGTMKTVKAISWECAVAEVEVDTETGQVDVLKVVHANEVGRAVNPMLVRGQVNGMMAMGLGFALYEDLDPYWPSKDFSVDSFEDYLITTAAEMPLENNNAILEHHNPNTAAGTMGFAGELGATPAAVLNAIHDATGVWVTSYPASPERVLRALKAAQA
jgi:CO/xanthine dehydrogenase Mo-binding subunit